MVDRMEKLTQDDPRFRLSQTESALLQCAHEVIAKGTATHFASSATDSATDGQEAEINSTHAVPWWDALESLRADQQNLSNPGTTYKAFRTVPGQQSHGVECEPVVSIVVDDYDDDLGQDLAKVALDTGNQAFEEQEWDEADSLLQEAFQAVQLLPQHQRTFCDFFDLHYKMAITAYHTQDPELAEEALQSFVRQTPDSDEQRGSIYNAMHLLSQLYIRTSRIERAREECEKALGARRRIFGKQSDASLESMALMAHIYVLLNQQPRAKIYLAMIPEAKRDAILALVENSLGPEVQHLDFASLLKSFPESVADSRSIRSDGQSTRGDDQSVRGETLSPLRETLSICEGSGLALGHTRDSTFSGTTYASPTTTSDYSPSSPKPYLSQNNASPIIPHTPPAHPPVPPPSNSQPLSRQQILDKVGCQPRDALEEAVCSGDAITLASLLHKRKHSWRTKLRGRSRPERVTALHFAALFGEVDMARRLLAANFGINEVPYGYSNPLTPLAFAVGARQTDMVDFLLNNGARPPEGESWSTLAGQLLTKAWLEKTLSSSGKDAAISRIISIYAILLKHGWNINAPYEKASGKTVLHQAVAFWTGDYKWNLELRKQVTQFLCERGADPWVANAEGKTPWDLAQANGHQDLLLLLGGQQAGKMRDDWRGQIAELSG